MGEKLRPTTVPQEAIWNASQNEWELGVKNDQGRHVGEWKWWLTPNGHLCCHTFFDQNGNLLNFKRFHPNGEVSRYGTYENGREVEDVYLKSSEPTTEVFAYGSTHEKVFKAVKKTGVPISFDYYDKEGNHLNPILEKKSLMTEEEAIISPEEIAQIKEEIYAKGIGFLRKQFDQAFYEGTIMPLVREQDQRMADNIIGTAVSNKQDLVYYDGDVDLSNLHCLAELEIGAIVINGNLSVSGAINLNDDLIQLLVVTGNVTVENVTTSGVLLVYGDLIVKNCLLGDYNHGSAVIGGNLSAKFFNPEEYFFEVNGTSTFTYAFGNSWRLNQNENEEAFNWNNRKLSEFIELLHENIHDAASFEENTSLLDDDCNEESLFEYIDRYELMSYIMANKPVFKN